MLLSLDYTSEENKQIIDLLLQCFHRPAHIRNDDVSYAQPLRTCFHDSLPALFIFIVVASLSSCQSDDVYIVTGKAIPGVSFQLERQLHLGYSRHNQKPAGVLQQVRTPVFSRRHAHFSFHVNNN